MSSHPTTRASMEETVFGLLVDRLRLNLQRAYPDLDPDEPVQAQAQGAYDSSGPGYMLVINNRFLRHPDKEKKRVYTKKSEEDLESTFRMFGFRLRLEQDVSYDRMQDLFKGVLEELDSGKYSCFALWILSHGRPKRQVETEDGQHLRVDNLPLIFSTERCPKMAGKPKLFFINACDGSFKGRTRSTASPVKEEGNFTLQLDGGGGGPDATTAGAAVSTSDYLIAYATTPYSPAYRDKHKGCYFVDDFCRAARTEWDKKDIEEILRGLRKDAEPIATGEGDMHRQHSPKSTGSGKRGFNLKTEM